MGQPARIFDTVPKKDHLDVFKGGRPNFENVINFFDFKREEVSKATGVPKGNIRFDARMPQELAQRLEEWAVVVDLVADHFQGDLRKTAMWFRLPNPLLGNISPRDMIRFGRFKKLLQFIQDSLAENEAP